MRLLMLIALLGLMKGLGSLGLQGAADAGHHSAMAFGFLILAGYVFGEWTLRMRMPAITGYLLAGLLCGPALLGLLDQQVVEQLKLFDRSALFLIALEAGGELRLESIRKQLWLIASSAVFQVLLGGLLMFTAFWLVRDHIPFLQGLSPLSSAALIALVAMVSVAKSPATSVAVIVETGAKGPMRDYSLGVTIVMDVVVILAFTLTRQLTLPLFHAGGESHLLQEVLLMLASISVGAACGLALILWMKRRQAHLHLVLLGFCLLMVRLSHDLHLESLLVAVGAGFVIANFSDKGQPFIGALEKISLPIYLVFFGITGASLDPAVLARLWPLALFFVAVRMSGKWASNWTASRLCRAEPSIRRQGWKGFLGQAGVSLGFAAIIADNVPQGGDQVQDMIIAAVLVNQLLGPILFKQGLEKAGEIPVA